MDSLDGRVMWVSRGLYTTSNDAFGISRKFAQATFLVVKTVRYAFSLGFGFSSTHQLIAQRQVGPVSVYCDGVGCHVRCERHGISVWQHIGQSTTATSMHRRDMTTKLMFQSDVKPKQTNKQTNRAFSSLPVYEIVTLTFAQLLERGNHVVSR